jgi:predicted dehydrogenase
MIGLAVIGCGEWGPNHIRNFQSQSGARVLAAVDLVPKRLDRVRALFPNLNCESDAAKVFRDERIQAVVIATPLRTHYALVRDALLADKHVLCEKPLCETTAQARELVDLAKQRKLILMVGHVFLFNPGIIKVKQLVDTGELGRLHYLLAIRTNLGPIRKDCNVAFDLATHDISIFNWFMESEPTEVSATGASFLQAGIEDVVSISLTYPGNVFASIQASWLNPKKIRQITVVGSQQMVTWDDLQLGVPVACYDKRATVKKQYADYGEFLRVSTWEGDVRLPHVGTEEPLRRQAHYFLEAVETRYIETSEGEFSLGVVKTLEAVAASLQQNGRPIPVRVPLLPVNAESGS